VRNYFGDIKTLLIVVLGVIIFLTRSCQGGSDITEPQVITEVVTQWDTVKVENTKYIPKVIERIVVNIDTFTTPIDTLSVLQDYYAKYFYTDTIKIDTLGYVTINDTITRNLISFRDVQSEILIPTTTITNTVYINKRELYWGTTLNGDRTQLNNLSGNFLYKTKKRNVYNIGVGVDSEFKPVYTIGMYWKLSK
jgi:hypothetical protein